MEDEQIEKIWNWIENLDKRLTSLEYKYQND